jgi:hypothetical protein
MAWTTPRTWATNDGLTASLLNQHLRDNLNHLYGAPRCRVRRTTTQSIATGTWTAITFDAERFDNDTMHSTSVNTSRITCVTAGQYMIGGSIATANNATGLRGIGVRINGATYITGATYANVGAIEECLLSTATYYALAAADYAELMARQDSGGALNINANGNYTPEFWAVWQGN